MKITSWLAPLALSLALAACGGGGSGLPATPSIDSVPDSASASVGGMLAWLKALTGFAWEDREALDASTFAPPRPDDREPEAL